MTHKSAAKIQELIEESGVLDNKKNNANYPNLLKETIENLSYISFMKGYNLVNVLELDSLNVDGKGIEDTILKSIFECKFSIFYFLVFVFRSETTFPFFIKKNSPQK